VVVASTFRTEPQLERGEREDLQVPVGELRRALGALAARDPTARLLAMSGRLVDGVRADLYGDALAEVRDDNAYATIEALRGGLDGNPLADALSGRGTRARRPYAALL
jgi:hypothetical protein